MGGRFHRNHITYMYCVQYLSSQGANIYTLCVVKIMSCNCYVYSSMYIYPSPYSQQIDHPESPPMVLSGHIKEVTAVAWCPSYLDKVATCSDNNDIRLWYVAGLCMLLAVRPMCTGIIFSIICVLCRRAVRQRNWVPGEFIGTCEHYTGEGKQLLS